MSPTTIVGASPRLRSHEMARVTSLPLSAAAAAPSAQPYACATCSVRRRPQCTAACCRRCRSPSLS
eukprot:2067108-Lingulodinium_polyedra.AAC.1